MMRTLSVPALSLVVCSALLLPAAAGPGATWNVSTVAELNNAVGRAQPYDEIVLAPGTYHLTRGVQMNAVGLTVRGATGNRDDVVLVGSGMNTYGVNEGILVNTDNLTIRDLTLKDFYWNAIHIRGENDADNVLISNVKTWNIGQRHVKGSGGGGPSAVSDNVVIENLYMLQDRPRADGNHHGDYIGGIDAMGVRNWVIRDSLAEGIVGHFDGGNAAIFLWQGVQGVTIERNVILSCAKGIALGNPSGPNSGIFTYPYHAEDVLIRNNVVLRGPWTTGNNIGLELCNVRDVDVLNNTFYSPNASYFRMISPYDESDEARLDDVVFRNNIIRGGVRDFTVSGEYGADDLAAMGNIVDTTGAFVTADWFVDAAAGDFHLTDQAAPAIDQAADLPEVPTDADGVVRPWGPGTDYGAYEYRYLIPGDANDDGRVNAADLAILATNWQKDPAGWQDGNFNADTIVNVQDLSVLATMWGTGVPPAGGAAPEPTMLLLLCPSVAALLARRHA